MVFEQFQYGNQTYVAPFNLTQQQAYQEMAIQLNSPPMKEEKRPRGRSFVTLEELQRSGGGVQVGEFTERRYTLHKFGLSPEHVIPSMKNSSDAIMLLRCVL